MFLLDIVFNPVDELLWGIKSNPEVVLVILAVAVIAVISLVVLKKKRG